MLLWSLRVNIAVFGFLRVAHGMSPWFLHAGGWAGIVTAAIAWYASAAAVINGMAPSPVLPVGRPLWGRLPSLTREGSPMPRQRAA
jgi:succinate-acetate transporter protein